MRKNHDPNLRGKYNYNNIASWGSSEAVPVKDIFDLKYIFIPINELGLGNGIHGREENMLVQFFG